MAPSARLPDAAPEPSPEPPSIEESADGVDLTLIRWTLSLTPLQRLEVLQDWVDGLAELRHGRIAERQPVAMLPVLRQTLAIKTRAERDRRD